MGGYSTSALTLSTVTDTLPGSAALSYTARTGAVVVRTYTLTDHSEADIAHVGIDDPDAGGAGGCGRKGRGRLDVAAWSSVTCTTRFMAVAGTHRTRVVASGAVDDAGTLGSAGTRIYASADAGYYAATPKLSLRESLGLGTVGRVTARAAEATAPVGSTVRMTYTVSNDGDIPLVNVTVTDSQPIGALTCGSGASDISLLPPGASRVCTAALRAGAGPHSGSAEAIGTEPERSVSAAGPGAPIRAEAVAYSSYTGICGPSTTPTGATTSPVHTPTPPPTVQASVPVPIGALPSGRPGHGQLPSPVEVARPGTGSRPSGAGAVPGIAPQAAPPQVHGQGAGSGGLAGGGHPASALVRRQRRALSLLMILLVVALVPAVLLLLRRGAAGRG